MRWYLTYYEEVPYIIMKNPLRFMKKAISTTTLAPSWFYAFMGCFFVENFVKERFLFRFSSLKQSLITLIHL